MSAGRHGALRISLHRFHGGRRPPDTHVRGHLFVPRKCEEPQRKGEFFEFKDAENVKISILVALNKCGEAKAYAGDAISSVTCNCVEQSVTTLCLLLSRPLSVCEFEPNVMLSHLKKKRDKEAEQ